MPDRRPRIRCRPIVDGDISQIVDLLLKSGFPGNRSSWMRGMARLAAHPTPEGFPKYGFMLEIDGIAVGVLLMIASEVGEDRPARVRCNVSSWFVWPAFRNYASLMVSRALSRRDATYFNISPLPFTLPILSAQGYKQYCSGRFFALPALNWGPGGVRLTRLGPDTDLLPFGLPQRESELLRQNIGYGCLGVMASFEGRHHPFLFDVSRRYRTGRLSYLVYCREMDDFVRLAGPIGRFLARRGYPVVVLDANGPVRHLFGKYFDSTPKYARGPHFPRLGDLAYSEQVMFGVFA